MIKQGNIVDHERYGKGKVTSVEEASYKIDFGKLGIIEVSMRMAPEVLTLLPDEPENELNMNELEKTLKRILEEYSDIQQPVELGDKWDGGTLIIKPANPNMKSKEIPIDAFFHKIVMVRDRLRVLEQNINSHAKLTDEDKVNMQQYITRIYGSLTTFNVLFKKEDDHFVGDKKSGD